MEKTTVSRWTRLDMVLGAARNGSAQSCIVFGMEQNTAKNGSSQSCIVIQFVFGFVSCTMLPGIALHNNVLYLVFCIMHNIARNRTILYCIAFCIEHNTARKRTIGRLQGAQIWC